MEIPIRIQRKRIKGWRLSSPNGLPIVYVGRGSNFGNPFIVGKKPETKYLDDKDYSLYKNKLLSNEEAVYLFKKYMPFAIKEAFPYLKGKNMMCWCGLDDLCHADILLSMANNIVNKQNII